MPIDCKRNRVEINEDTHECTNVPGLYALGPLVGENFVRFLQGGALAITNHVEKQRKENECSGGEMRDKLASANKSEVVV